MHPQGRVHNPREAGERTFAVCVPFEGLNGRGSTAASHTGLTKCLRAAFALMGGMCYLSLVTQLRAMLAVGLALCAYSCEPATTPPLTSQHFAPLAGVVRLVGSPSAGHISPEGTLSLVVRPVDARTILQTWTRDLADPVVGEADGGRFLHFRLEVADLPRSMTEVVLEARFDPDGLITTDEPGSVRVRRVVALSSRPNPLELRLEVPIVMAEHAEPVR